MPLVLLLALVNCGMVKLCKCVCLVVNFSYACGYVCVICMNSGGMGVCESHTYSSVLTGWKNSKKEVV